MRMMLYLCHRLALKKQGAGTAPTMNAAGAAKAAEDSV